MNYKEKIFILIGELIELIQYIEWNLCIELDIDGLGKYTLGQIKNMIIEEEIFEDDTADELVNILERRNDLIHKYFKRLDFEKHSDNYSFLVNQFNYLSNFLKQVQEFNNVLVEEDEE